MVQFRSTESWNIRPEVPSRFTWPAIVRENFQPRAATAPGDQPLTLSGTLCRYSPV